MSKINDYLEFKKYEPEYASWKENREQNLQKKTAYLKKNPVSKDEFKKEIERAKVVLNAINTMDDYSQSRAEDMEEVALSVEGGVIQIASVLSMILCVIAGFLTKGAQSACEEVKQGNFKNILKLVPMGIAAVVPIAVVSTAMKFWATKKEIQASRQGRQEAMNGDLASCKQFAILDENQQKEVEKIAGGIKVSSKEAKQSVNATRGLGITKSISILLKKEDKAQISKTLPIDESRKLSEKDILEAKKDKELIQMAVEKIDVASQDYAENAELATGAVQSVVMGSSAIGGFILSKIAHLFKMSDKNSKILGLAGGAAAFFGFAISSAKIQKQASKVGRFKAKNELLANPEQLVYADSDKYKNEKIEYKKQEKPGFFKGIIQLFKDNKEYNDYIKQNSKRNVALSKAREQINITKEQETRARQLQKNVFNMFNKLDEKSQTYSESTEALGESLVQLISFIAALPATVAMAFAATSKNNAGKKTAIGAAASIGLSMLANLLITKEQRKASRVAEMQAIKEMDDYRYFAAEKNETVQAEPKTYKNPLLNDKNVLLNSFNGAKLQKASD